MFVVVVVVAVVVAVAFVVAAAAVVLFLLFVVAVAAAAVDAVFISTAVALVAAAADNDDDAIVVVSVAAAVAVPPLFQLPAAAVFQADPPSPLLTVTVPATSSGLAYLWTETPFLDPLSAPIYSSYERFLLPAPPFKFPIHSGKTYSVEGPMY